MGSLCKDLDIFLKTDGFQIVMESEGTRITAYEPPVIDDYGIVSDIDPESLDKKSLKDLLNRAEALKGALEDQFSAVEDLIDRIQNCLEEPE